MPIPKRLLAKSKVKRELAAPEISFNSAALASTLKSRELAEAVVSVIRKVGAVEEMSSCEAGETVPIPRRLLVSSQKRLALSWDISPPVPAKRIEPAVNPDKVRPVKVGVPVQVVAVAEVEFKTRPVAPGVVSEPKPNLSWMASNVSFLSTCNPACEGEFRKSVVRGSVKVCFDVG